MGADRPRQLALPIQLADHARLANFLAVGNEPLLAALAALAAGHGRSPLWVAGAPGSGRSHLLQAVVAAVPDDRRAAYVPLDPALGLPPAALDGLGDLALVAVDDADRVAGDPAFEAALFRLYEGLAAAGGALVVAGRSDVGDAGFRLPDLVSRLGAGLRFAIQPLDDAGRLAALQLRARFRGLELPDDTGRYLLNRVDRGLGPLFRLLDTLDREALESGRRLTVPFVRTLLG